jgi:transposase
VGSNPRRAVILVRLVSVYSRNIIKGSIPDIVLAHPLKTRAIASARIKTDKIDSKILTHLLRNDLVPTAYIPDREIRDIREVLRYRASLVMNQTMLKNKIHAILTKKGIFPFSYLSSKKDNPF